MELLKYIIYLFSICLIPTNTQELLTTQVENGEERIYVLFVGLSGSGKSSTINVLFDTDIAPVGDAESTTFEIQEYSVKLPNNLKELRIIDTPGMEDTQGLENDAQFLATLEKYLENNEELRYRAPDVIVVCSRFDDNRFSGQSSKFVKMLRGISVLQNKMLKDNNVVFLLTHLMGADEKETINPSEKKAKIENTIKDYTLFPSPIHIVVGENKGEDQELSRVDLGYQLPNGEIYPHNLCESIKEILINSNSTKEKFWSLACPWNNSVSKTIKLVSQVPLLSQNDTRSLKMLQFLMAANFKTEETEISVKLSETFHKLPRKEKFPADTLVYLQKALHYRFLTKLSDIPTTDAEIAALFRNVGRMSDAAVILKEAFGIQMPNFPFDPLVGNCFDVLQDDALTTTPFETNKESATETAMELGYLAPPGIITTLQTDRKTFNSKFANEDEYLKHRAFLLGVGNEFPSLKGLEENLKPGFNLISRNECPSFYIEFRACKFELGNKTFSSVFKYKLSELQEFNPTSPNSIRNWERFFRIYGTHVIITSYGGGSIEFSFEGYPCNSKDLKDIVDKIMNGDNGALASETDRKLLKISGGDPKLYSENPEVFFKGGKKSLFNSWKESLDAQPAVLLNDVKVKSIMEMLRTSNLGALAEKMQKAANFFYKDEPGESQTILTEEFLKEENFKLSRKIDLVASEKSSCLAEKSTLLTTIDKIQSEKSEVEKNTLKMAQELRKAKELVGETQIKLEEQKTTSQILQSDIQGCQATSAGVKSELEIEKTHIQSLKQMVASTQSKISELQTKELNLQGQLNQCNGRQCNGPHHGHRGHRVNGHHHEHWRGHGGRHRHRKTEQK